MTTFQEYESKPITRLAHCITENDVKSMIELEANLYSIDGVDFQAYEEIKAGSYIVYLKDDDIYHCNEEVFKERNIV